MENLKNQEMEIDVLHWGIFTLVTAKHSESSITGYGISKLGFRDRYSKKRGEEVAKGRAIKSLKLKTLGERIPSNKYYYA